MKTKKLLFLAVLVLLSLTGLNQLYAQQLAFPTAEGYGKYTTGGRGGSIYEVTNLNSSGSGSLGDALSSGNRIVVFRVGGTINGSFTVRGNTTIAGQTAPGDGIAINGYLGIGGDNVIIRYIRIRGKASGDVIGGRYHDNIIVDHVSASWSSDEVMSIYHGNDVTIQWSMITEAGSSDHRFGGIWGNNHSTYHHNLFAHNTARNPRIASGSGYNDLRNNVIYNWREYGIYGGEKYQPGNSSFTGCSTNVVGNYMKPGPGTSAKDAVKLCAPWSRVSSGGDDDWGKWYVADNYMYGSSSITADNWEGVIPIRRDNSTETDIWKLDARPLVKLNTPSAYMPINQQTAEDAYISVLAGAGCSFPSRDAVDTRIINEVSNGTYTYGDHGFISKPSDVGGVPPIAGGNSPADSDHDGMPDSWETANGLNPNNAADRNNIGADGYTMVEIYINSLVDDTTPTVPVTGITIAPTSVSVNTGATTQLTATVAPSNATNKTVSWSSSNTSVASVSSTGLVTGVAGGSATITVTTQDGNKTASSAITVTTVNIPVVGVSVTPAISIGVSATSQLTASVAPSNASNKSVSWSSSKTSVAIVNSLGLVTGVATGTAIITATTQDGGFTATCNVTVSNIVSTTITVQENETGFVSVDGSIDNNNSGFTGDGFANTDNATGKGINWEICTPENGTYTLVWRSANGSSDNRTAQLKVDGSVEVSNVSFPSTGSWSTWNNSSAVNLTLSAGTHQIRLEATNSSGLANIDYASITGNGPKAGECSTTDIPVTGVIISPTSVSANVGTTTQLSATVSPSNATNKNVSWSSSNSSIASVNSIGLVTGVAEGSAVITVTTEDGSFKAICNISVLDITKPTYELTTSINGNGILTPTGGIYEEGSIVTLIASPATGWSFDNWAGDASGSSNPVSITMDSDKLVTANFFGGEFSLTTTVNGQGSIEPANGSYPVGAVITLTANPADGWNFVSWSGDISSTENPLLLPIDGDKLVTANFSEATNPTTITIQENETGFCSVDGSIDNNNGGFTGAGFANTDNSNGNGITWSVNIPTAGSYNIVFRYANGGSTDRTAQLMEDGSTIVSNISMPSTGSWTSWSETSAINVNLSAGTILVRLQATNSSGLSNIDYMTISGENMSPAACIGLKNAQESSEIADTDFEMDVKFYPNPVDNLLKIEFSRNLIETVDITLFDITGKIITNDQTNGSIYTLDMSDIPYGIYSLRIAGNNLNRVERIVKQ